MRFMQRSLMGLFLLAVTAGLLALAAGTIRDAFEARNAAGPHRPQAKERVFAAEVLVATPTTARPHIRSFGEIRSTRTLDLRAATGGRIVKLSPRFVEGGRVRAGEVLMQLDTADARAALERAETELAAARAELADARAALALAGEELKAAERQADLQGQALKRQQDLLDRGVGTEAALETAALQKVAADQAVLARRQAVAQARARVSRAETDIRRREIALADARRALADTTLTAAFDGLLGSVSAVEGGLVARNERVGRLIDPTALEVSFRLSNSQFARLFPDGVGADAPAAPVTVRLDVFGEGFAVAGRVSRVGAEVGAGQTGRQVFATLDAGAERVLQPGDFVTVEVAEPPLDDVIALPATALDAARTVLVVGPDDRLSAQPVKVLRRLSDRVLVAPEGLAGQRVVAVRSPLLGAGIKVRPLPWGEGRPGEAGGGSAPGTGDRADAAGGERMITLTPERRAKLMDFVKTNGRIPRDVKTRLLKRLAAEKVPAEMVARIEARMGG